MFFQLYGLLIEKYMGEIQHKDKQVGYNNVFTGANDKIV
jgi:hypothetical protein